MKIKSVPQKWENRMFQEKKWLSHAVEKSNIRLKYKQDLSRKK
jgi:hypothetical protein